MLKDVLLSIFLISGILFFVLVSNKHELKATTSSFLEQKSYSDTINEKTTEQEFKNIQVLKGIPASQLLPAMRFISFSLGVRCDFCHVTSKSGNWPMEKDDKETKQTARDMMRMMKKINEDNFEGRIEVTCATCHNGNSRPVSVPPLLHEKELVTIKTDSVASVNEILNKYVEAIGGKSAFENIKTKIIKGNLTPKNGKPQSVEMFQSSPDKYFISITSEQGENINGYNGKKGWAISPRRKGEIEMDELNKIKKDAVFNQEIKIDELYSNLKVRGIQTLGNLKLIEVDGVEKDGGFTKMFFDENSGLLIKKINYVVTPLGSIPEEINFNDYRQVSGIKYPFTINYHGTNFEQVLNVSEIILNQNIDDTKYDMPVLDK